MFTDGEENVLTHCRIEGLTTLILPRADLPRLYSLGMTKKQKPQRYVVSAGEAFGTQYTQYNDLLIEFFGTEGTWPQREVVTTRNVGQWAIYGSQPLSDQQPHDRFNGGMTLRYPWSDGINVMNVWRLRVFFKEHSYSKPYLEQLWIPQEAKWRVKMKNILTPHLSSVVSSVKRLADGLPLLVLSIGHKIISGYTEQEIEEMIDAAIEKMAQSEPNKSHPRPFRVARFVSNWRFSLSRTGIYNYVTDKNRFAKGGEFETRYLNRCKELADEE
jgi:hypothetical protein